MPRPSPRQRTAQAKKEAWEHVLRRIDWYHASTSPASSLSPANEWALMTKAIRAYGRCCAAAARAPRKDRR